MEGYPLKRNLECLGMSGGGGEKSIFCVAKNLIFVVHNLQMIQKNSCDTRDFHCLCIKIVSWDVMPCSLVDLRHRVTSKCRVITTRQHRVASHIAAIFRDQITSHALITAKAKEIVQVIARQWQKKQGLSCELNNEPPGSTKGWQFLL
jgi:hypothetical protein